MIDDASTAAVETAIDTNDFTPPPEPVSEPRSVEATPRDAIERAFAAIDGDKPDRSRDESGKFAAKDATQKPTETVQADKAAETTETTATTFVEPPKRFSPDAKAAWSQAPEPVRAEITRAVAELEKGLSEYKAKFEPLREFDQLAQQSGTTIDKALQNYVGIERLIASDPIKGLSQVCENMGLSLRDVAAHVLGQTPDQSASQQDNIIRELRRELAAVRQEVSGVTTSIRSQTEQQVLNEIMEFSKDKPRFEELSGDIEFFLNTKRATTLQDAYALAERLNPSQTQQPATVPQTAQPDPAHTRKGNLSLSGAPRSGSNPATRRQPSSARESLDSAFAQVGL